MAERENDVEMVDLALFIQGGSVWAQYDHAPDPHAPRFRFLASLPHSLNCCWVV